MSTYEKILLSILAVNLISWIFVLYPQIEQIVERVNNKEGGPLVMWFVLAFWSTLISICLLAINFIWSF